MKEKAMTIEDRIYGREELYAAKKQIDPTLGWPSFLQDLEKDTKEGELTRVGRDSYVARLKAKKEYRHSLSPEATKVLECLEKEYPSLPFSLFELIQLNEFANHQLAQNLIFASFPSSMGEYAYSSLRNEFPSVLFRPTLREVDLYGKGDTIILNRLVSESPLSKQDPHQGSLEKILADLVLDPLLSRLVSPSEWPTIFEDSFAKYPINEDRMFRYARRRHGEERLLEFIQSQTGVRLYTRERKC